MEHKASLPTYASALESANHVSIERKTAASPFLLLGANYIASLLGSGVVRIEEEEIKNCDESTVLFYSSPCETSARLVKTLEDFNNLSSEMTPNCPLVLSLLDDFSEVASAFAASMHRTLILVEKACEAKRLAARAPSISVIASPHSLNSAVIGEIFELVGFHADTLYQKVPFGILTALTKEGLKKLLGRIALHQPMPRENLRSVLSLSEEDRRLTSTTETTILLNREESQIETVKGTTQPNFSGIDKSL